MAQKKITQSDTIIKEICIKGISLNANPKKHMNNLRNMENLFLQKYVKMKMEIY